MYGPIAAGPYGACQEIYPRPLADDGLCDCGRPKIPGDFVCHECRRRLDEDYRRWLAEVAGEDAGDDCDEGLFATGEEEFCRQAAEGIEYFRHANHVRNALKKLGLAYSPDEAEELMEALRDYAERWQAEKAAQAAQAAEAPEPVEQEALLFRIEGRCHTCGTKLVKCLDGKEWCPQCQQYRSVMYNELSPCPADAPDGVTGGLVPIEDPDDPEEVIGLEWEY